MTRDWRFGRLARVGLVTLVATVTSTVTIAAADAGAAELDDLVAATSHTPAEYIDTFDLAELPGLGDIGPAPAITGDAVADDRIRRLGEARGYRRRPEPSRELVVVDGVRLQPEAAFSWLTLKAAAHAAGHELRIVSGYRSGSAQASILRRRMAGTSDAAIERGLTTAALPGYSKHHTGYAVDIRSTEAGGFAFAETDAFDWLAADDFANAKAHGWIPSYPEGSTHVGPEPEPWEFVWVGAINIVCGDMDPAHRRLVCSRSRTDLRRPRGP